MLVVKTPSNGKKLTMSRFVRKASFLEQHHVASCEAHSSGHISASRKRKAKQTISCSSHLRRSSCLLACEQLSCLLNTSVFTKRRGCDRSRAGPGETARRNSAGETPPYRQQHCQPCLGLGVAPWREADCKPRSTDRVFYRPLQTATCWKLRPSW